jgi:hypothetical protein
LTVFEVLQILLFWNNITDISVLFLLIVYFALLGKVVNLKMTHNKSRNMSLKEKM